MSLESPLIDRFGRRHTSLRLSVTDRCNLRCFYCMPEHGAQFAPRESLLTFEEITRIVSLLASRCGIRDLRLTGGEPLVRRDLPELVRMISKIDGIKDLSLTTNGLLLPEFARPLRDAGMKRLNISIDTLDEQTFQKISRRQGIDKVIAGIDAAIACGFEVIKLNTTAVRGIAESEIVSLVRFAVDRGVQIRFIEFMPLDTDRSWRTTDVLSGDAIRDIIERELGPLVAVAPPNPSQPASEFEFVGASTETGAAGQRIGLIQSVSKPFCESCDRIRVTADGSIRNCLFSQQEFSLRDLLRSGADDDQLVNRFRTAVDAKAAGHGITEGTFSPPDRPMYSIGG
ncbi:GTP 3',8-cyclase MoaA [Stieleria sp. TO1_6]|uniref:GTP 3',8-cyclase MoaA n=1 Tax=Stieleria tagensis TaxID=2956795 RepID=UPI00209AE123|nr:GTP 3',8-cyclase MoaA [Stieleria tagensis]MCO8122643.1 GTP 3',8-cyclase MoaA [Stieleria tagensis]